MTWKEKIILGLITLLTLGIYPLIVFARKDKQVNNSLSNAKKISINVEKLIEFLGGTKNIAGSEFTHTKVKIFLHNRLLADPKKIQEIKGISGVAATSKTITIIVGNQAKLIAESL